LKPKSDNLWWGPPKKFSADFQERKISWLELFFDLVYVIAISKINHHLAVNFSVEGFLDYLYFFVMIFWGWLNGSLHHDLHGSTGLRTNLMTLWQILIVAALVVILDNSPATLLFNGTIAIMAMQLFITYLWWSVGVYDKTHRKLNRPYTICFLISLALMLLTLFLPIQYVRVIFYLTLIINFLPAFIIKRNFHENSFELRLSSSMTERLGLLTIILFGEVVLGVINGVTSLKKLNGETWINFALAILIVFSLWWIFFSLIADREAKNGFIFPR
jgi:low temperature requirement protein LtrA